jgi:ribosomal protein S18 acetylase RimI-like enzyme
MTQQSINERFTFREIYMYEIPQAIGIEQVCFPPNEACSAQAMKERIACAPELFLVAIENESGLLAGFLNGLATDETTFRDEFFTDANLHNYDGKNIMLLGLDVLPQYRMQGLARELVNQYCAREQARGREALILTCLEEKVEMYKKFQFEDDGMSNSTWGGEQWHQMTRRLK